jgi:hypothetical protein
VAYGSLIESTSIRDLTIRPVDLPLEHPVETASGVLRTAALAPGAGRWCRSCRERVSNGTGRHCGGCSGDGRLSVGEDAFAGAGKGPPVAGRPPG